MWKEIAVTGAGGISGTIFVDENAATKWVDGDLVITYSNTTVRGGLRFFDPERTDLKPVWAQARILAVGGGGGGGMISIRNAGGGGGGGAGGMIEESGFLFSRDVEYTISVGRGGAGGTQNKEPGKNGENSSIKTNGVSVLRGGEAIGGGGGGAESAGAGGGSGGGGSRSTTKEEGGSGTSGQGHAGGADENYYRGAGGGGAGTNGYNSTSSAPGGGGAGRLSDITGSSLMYAGGGGGAGINPTTTSTSPGPGGRGGSGGGGNGAGVEENGTVVKPAENGADGFGGGGGGGVSHANADETAGNGGSGIVIIRLSNFVVDYVPYPEPLGPYTYDANAHTGLVEFFVYELSGDARVATNAASYTVTATIDPNAPWAWENGRRDPYSITWTIKPLPVDVPYAPQTFTYDGLSHQVDISTYRVDANGYGYTTNNIKYCQLTDWKKTNAGVYTVRAKLVDVGLDGQPAMNFEWREGGTDEISAEWEILQFRENVISNFYYDTYRMSRLSSHNPTTQFDIRFGKTTAKASYRMVNPDDTYGEWTPWGAAGPTTNGNYEVRVEVDETTNWNGATNTLPFGVWTEWKDIFEDRMEITVNYTAAAVDDFPVPVKVKEPARDGYEQYSGFLYARAGQTGEEVRFFDKDGDPVEFEVDTWNVRGESLLWVRLPHLTKTSTNNKLTMCWKRTGNIRQSPYNPTVVWKDYIGVWHMNAPEKNRFLNSAGIRDLDAGVPVLTGEYELVPGKFGTAVHMLKGDLKSEDYTPYIATATGPFTFSGWYCNTASKASNYNFVGTKAGKAWNVGPGWSFFMNTATKVGASAEKSWDNGVTYANIATTFHHLVYVSPASGNRNIYYDGANQKSIGGNVANQDGQLQIIGETFTADEVRMRKGTPGTAATAYAAWAAAEYNSLNKADFCQYGLVIREELKCDWWTTVPSIAKTMWKEGETSPTVTKGVYKDASSNVRYICVNGADGTATTNKLPTAIGFYRATFDHTNPAGYRPQPHVIDFYIIEKVDPTHDISGNGGDSGRILLMNADNRSVSGENCSVTNQGWCVQSPTNTVTYWRVPDGAGGGTPPPQSGGTNNVMPGTNFELVRSADTNVLWTLTDCRQGNLFPTNDAETLSSQLVYLPKSPALTALSIRDETAKATRSSTGWILMRNSTDAAVESGLFTNGIGTIYFDAVNSRYLSSSVAKTEAAFRLKLEIAYEPAEGQPLEWRPVVMSATKFNGSAGSTTQVSPTNELSLAVATGGRENYFYRVHATVCDHRPLRMRLRRTAIDESAVTEEGTVERDASYLLVDNLIVSVPPVFAQLEPYGRFVVTNDGVRATGAGGAMSRAFPSAFGGPFAGRCRVVLPPGAGHEGEAPSAFISLGQMFYRWRHLARFEDFAGMNAGEWKVAVLRDDEGGGMRTVEDLKLPAVPGDVEFSFVSIMKSPYYGYVDYTGLGFPVVKTGDDYTEEVFKHESRLDPLELGGRTALASGGTDWFVRLWEGASEWEGIDVELRGAYTNDAALRIEGDGTWRGFVKIPTNVTGTCTFVLRGRNRQADGSKTYETNSVTWGGLSMELPISGKLLQGGAPVPFKVDHAGTHLEFRFDDRDESCSVSRAMMQNFDNWNDAHSPAKDPLFKANSSATNGVSDVAMTTYPAPIADWPVYVADDVPYQWDEKFKLASYEQDFGYPRDVVFANHDTPNHWSGGSIAFVQEGLGTKALVKVGGVYNPYPSDSGMAGKLKGQGFGQMSYLTGDPPDGLERLTFRARIGQATEADMFAYSEIPNTNRYLFTTLASMSHMITDDAQCGDMAAGGSVSLVAFYRERIGFYEFRIERIEKGACLMMSIWKWHQVNKTMTPECLVKRRFCVNNVSYKMWTNNSADPGGSDTLATANNKNPQYRLMFISVEDTGTLTKIYGGISHDAQLPYSSATTENSFDKMANGYDGLYFEDNEDDRGRYGAYGVGAKDCPAEFLRPKHKYEPVKGISPSAKDGEYLVCKDSKGKHFDRLAKNTSIGVSNAELTEDWVDIVTGFIWRPTLWTIPPNRIKSFVNDGWERYKTQMSATHHGLKVPTDLKQNVLVQTQGEAGAWETVASVDVEGYGFVQKNEEFDLKGRHRVRLVTGSDAVDVVVDDVCQRKWMGETDDRGVTEFVYTQGHVVSNLSLTAIQAKKIDLVPARAVKGTALSIRSPILKHGLGKIAFDYEGVDPDAEIWVQVATNNVRNNMTGENGFTLTTASADWGEPDPGRTWLTVEKFTYDDLKDGNFKTVYVGLHGVEGLFRLFIPAEKVEHTDAMTRDELRAGGKDYGKITITQLTVTDEPELDAYSWHGWNVRTLGDAKDEEGRMFLYDQLIADGGNGLSLALNNSLNDIDTKAKGYDPDKLKTGYPNVSSPLFGTYEDEFVAGRTNQAYVGQVTFRARLYDLRAGLPGKVTLWGSVDPQGRAWTKVKEFDVTNAEYQVYSCKMGEENYAAVKLEVTDTSAKTKAPACARILFDEVAFSERVKPSILVTYAWPFRTGLDAGGPIADYAAREQQPLAGEDWGVQTKLVLQRMKEDIDPASIRVSVAYFSEPPTAANWGYEQWKSRREGEIVLERVGDPAELVYRSVTSAPGSVMPPSPDAGTVVQFMVRVSYTDLDGNSYSDQLESWQAPAWYHPVDYNKTLGGSGKFAAFTILDTISPGRAWINEVNFNNGSKAVSGTSSLVENNQFIEVCVPSGVDMTGWTIRAYNLDGDPYSPALGKDGWTMARFGSTRVRPSKSSGSAEKGYEFFLLESPLTNKDGELRDDDGNPVVSDGVWSESGMTTASGGTFMYMCPYAFELVRPSGVVEHTFTIDGTNQYRDVWYNGDHLAEVLTARDHSPSRFYVGREQEKNVNGVKSRGTVFGSSGVVTGDQESGGPGSEGTWEHGLDMTPGKINQGQVIPEGWFLAPNGTNTWVNFSVVGSHLRQAIGARTNRSEVIILPQGMTTNVVYTADPWWELATVTVDGEVKAEHKRKTYRFDFSVPEGAGKMVNVVATEGVDARLDEEKFKLRGQRYRNAVLNWLGQEKWKDKDPDDIRFARMAQLRTPEATHEMTLIDMYWLDICPFNTVGEGIENPFEQMTPPKSEWVLRAGFTDYKPPSEGIIRHKGWGDVTNSVFKVKMFITNEFDCVNNPTHAPYTLQGIANERSCDGNYSGAWTSETFKINGFLDVNRDGGFNRGFLPFREFIFNRGSFAPAGTGPGTDTVSGDENDGAHAGTPGDFETVIELLDPFSSASAAGASYGWRRWPNNTPAFFSWRINHTNATPTTIEMLKPQSTYGE